MRSSFLLVIVFIISVFSGCTGEQPKEPAFQLKEFNSAYMHLVIDSRLYCSLIEYKDGKVSKVIHKNSVGQSIPTITGYIEVDPIDSYHEFSYSGNVVEVIKKIDSDEIQETQEKIQLTLDEKGRIIKRIENNKDTTEYFYSENGLLDKSIRRNGSARTITKTFFFDSNNNLIKTKEEGDKYFDIDCYRIESFENYDTGINGFKNLGIVEGAFFRSLSQNNFNLYSRTTHNANNRQILEEIRIAKPVTYDDKGHPIYGDCIME